MTLNQKRRIEKLEKLQKKPPTIEEICDEVRKAGWPWVEITRHSGDWMVTFCGSTKYSLCTIRAKGQGETIMEAILKAKERTTINAPFVKGEQKDANKH